MRKILDLTENKGFIAIIHHSGDLGFSFKLCGSWSCTTTALYDFELHKEKCVSLLFFFIPTYVLIKIPGHCFAYLPIILAPGLDIQCPVYLHPMILFKKIMEWGTIFFCLEENLVLQTTR